LGRVINPNSVGKERQRLMRALAIALRELMRQADADQATRDLAAFIVLTLEAIDQTIDVTTTAWEKRGYWLKADRFRMEWRWAKRIGEAMREAVLSEDWAAMARLAAELLPHVSKVKLPQRHRLGRPWGGAWEHLVRERA